MTPKIKTIRDTREQVAQLRELYEASGARITAEGKYELPEPEDPVRAAHLSERAIAALRSERICKRNYVNPPARQLQEAFDLFQEAAMLNTGATPDCFNYGCCCYYMNLIENGQMFFSLILDQADGRANRPEFEAVVRYFATFYNHVVMEHMDSKEHARLWLEGKILVNPDFFMSRKNPHARPPERLVIDPDTLL